MAAVVDPHDKMRSRDITKVAKGQQASRPAHEPGTVSAPPPPSSTKTPEEKANEKEAEKKCYSSYLEYLKCTKQKGKGASECKKFADNYISNCPPKWIEKWEEERKHGIIHDHV